MFFIDVPFAVSINESCERQADNKLNMLFECSRNDTNVHNFVRYIYVSGGKLLYSEMIKKSKYKLKIWKYRNGQS